MRSDKIKKGLERVPHRALLHATGLSRKDLERPFIGVATSFTDLVKGLQIQINPCFVGDRHKVQDRIT